MTPNRSLLISYQIQEMMKLDILGVIEPIFPYELIDQFEPEEPKKRKMDRVYNTKNTVLTMILTAFQEDKSLKSSVKMFRRLFHARIDGIKARAVELAEQEKQADEKSKKSTRGRPKLYKPVIPKSKTQTISNNTASYSDARKRVPLSLMQSIFAHTGSYGDPGASYKWHGMEVYCTDGTYFQMQDSPELRRKYDVKKKDGTSVPGYPQGLLVGLVHQGSGRIADYRIGTRQTTELKLFADMISQIPIGSLVLADDLYNTYAIFAMLQQRGVHVIVPAKRVRNYTVISQLDTNDQIIQIKQTARPDWQDPEFPLPKTLTVRRVTSPKPSNPEEEYVLYTNLIDPKIPASEIIAKYFSRWDIEITIREIKTIMDTNIIRGKTEEMAFKEILAAFTAYNLLRRIIQDSVQGQDFFPKGDLIQKFIENYKIILVDKRGRIYNRWSTGRIPNTGGGNKG